MGWVNRNLALKQKRKFKAAWGKERVHGPMPSSRTRDFAYANQSRRKTTRREEVRHLKAGQDSQE